MARRAALWQLYLANLRGFYREPEAVFWVYVFPAILAVILSVAFKNRQPEPPVVDVQADPPTAEVRELAERLKAAGVDASVQPPDEAARRLRVGKTALVVVPEGDGVRYVYDDAREESRVARMQADAVVQRRGAAAGPVKTDETLLTEPGSRYIDFLMPGLLGMNLMGGGIFGIGFVIADLRVRKVLKRLLATPMRRGDFLLSIQFSRLTLMVPEIVFLGLIAVFGFGVPFRGSAAAFVAVVLVGSLAFAGVGVLVACRSEKFETVSGFANLFMMPQWLLSGVFFSSKRFPDVAQPFIQALPLTQVNDALREVMLEGAGLADVAWRLGVLAVWGAATFGLALRLFRWR